MNKRLIAFVPAALAAGVVLLSACGHADNGARTGSQVKIGQSTQANAGKPARTDGVAAGGDTVEQAECGQIQIHSVDQTLIADSTPQGRVGCTEAFDVISPYLDLSPMPAGWTCDGVDLGYQAVKCANAQGLTFHTEETGKETTPETTPPETTPADDAPVESVDCGSIDIHSVQEMLVADGTPQGRVGCTEAFDVISVYLDASPVPAGWTCNGVIHPTQAVTCQADDGRTFHTEER